ncbi:hypothetical protein NL676_001953 [Syzygium grande]|nr:hypothetical protein NL676_001953 [Syzygium grande]
MGSNASSPRAARSPSRIESLSESEEERLRDLQEFRMVARLGKLRGAAAEVEAAAGGGGGGGGGNEGGSQFKTPSWWGEWLGGFAGEAEPATPLAIPRSASRSDGNKEAKLETNLATNLKRQKQEGVAGSPEDTVRALARLWVAHSHGVERNCWCQTGRQELPSTHQDLVSVAGNELRLKA